MPDSRPYDPQDFAHGIDVLEKIVAGTGFGDRAHILEMLLEQLEYMKGDIHLDLQNYLAELSLFPDDEIDFTRLRLLHSEFSAHWGSSTDLELTKSRRREEELRPDAQRGAKLVRAASAGGRARSKWRDRAPELQREIDAIYKENPDLSYAEIKRRATRRFGYPESALKRYTKNPKN